MPPEGTPINDRFHAQLKRAFAVLLAGLLPMPGCGRSLADFEDGIADRESSGCRPGEYRCNEEQLLWCDVDGSWFSTEQCASAEQCDAGAGRCLVCPEAGKQQCFGTELRTCSADRTRWERLTSQGAEVCGEPGATCLTPGQMQCTSEDGAVQIRQCDEKSGFWALLTNCPSFDVCWANLELARDDPAAWDGECKSCPSGEFLCDGAKLLRCPISHPFYVSVGLCESEAACVRTLNQLAKSPDLDTLEGCSRGTPGDQRCSGQFLEELGEDAVWSRVKDCESPALCDLTADSRTGQMRGACRSIVCHRGERRCGTEADPSASGPMLWACSADLARWEKVDTCASAALCDATEKKCLLPPCEWGDRRCNPSRPREVQTCRADRTGWEVTICPGPGLCDPDDTERPCTERPCTEPPCTEPPLETRCNGRFLQDVSAERGHVARAECLTRELCECALWGNCAAGIGADGCGVPLCGGDLPRVRCVGAMLQRCAPGRHGWRNHADCGEASRCSASSGSCTEL